MNKTVGIVIGVAVVVCLALGGGAWWWVQQQTAGQGVQAPKVQAPKLDASKPSYVTLEKVVVMLRSATEQGANHYLSMDVVLRTDKANEKSVKGDLPMIKGVAVRALSKLDVEQARAMSIEEWTDLLSRDVMAAYAPQMELLGFDQLMVSRLIIE